MNDERFRRCSKCEMNSSKPKFYKDVAIKDSLSPILSERLL